MRADVHAHADDAHGADDREPHDVPRPVRAREQVGAVDLGEVAERVDQRQRHGARARRLPPERRRRVGQGEGVGGPEARGHENEQDVARGEVGEDGHGDGCRGCEGQPAGDGEAAVMRVLVEEVGG